MLTDFCTKNRPVTTQPDRNPNHALCFWFTGRIVEPVDSPPKMKILQAHRIVQIPFGTGTYIKPFHFKIINLHTPFSTGPCLSAPRVAQKKDRRISLCFCAHLHCPTLADHVLALYESPHSVLSQSSPHPQPAETFPATGSPTLDNTPRCTTSSPLTTTLPRTGA